MSHAIWPRTVLPPRKVVPEIDAATTGGGRTITGIEQIIASDAGFWAILLDEIPFASLAQKRAWRQISGQLRGRKGLCDVPIYDTDCAPWPIINGRPFKSYSDIPHSDGALFSDGTGYYQDVIVATVVANAALGSTLISLDLVYGSALLAGQHFSVLAGENYRLYRIKRVQNFGSPGIYDLTITPPLREAVAAGISAEFDDPLCTCRLKTDREMESGIDDYAGRTLASVKFVEALP